jgi:hypothetical protein
MRALRNLVLDVTDGKSADEASTAGGEDASAHELGFWHTHLAQPSLERATYDASLSAFAAGPPQVHTCSFPPADTCFNPTL